MSRALLPGLVLGVAYVWGMVLLAHLVQSAATVAIVGVATLGVIGIVTVITYERSPK